MARLRRFRAYHTLERPYTRVSKFKKKAFVKARPHKNLIRYDMGTFGRKYTHQVILTPKVDHNVRDNSMESARQTSNKILESSIGTPMYFFKIHPYPHHILREHSLASGAGADRFSSGMAHPFGKPLANAVRLRKGQTLFSVKVDKVNIPVAIRAMKRAATKLPFSCYVLVNELKEKAS